MNGIKQLSPLKRRRIHDVTNSVFPICIMRTVFTLSHFLFLFIFWRQITWNIWPVKEKYDAIGMLILYVLGRYHISVSLSELFSWKLREQGRAWKISDMCVFITEIPSRYIHFFLEKTGKISFHLFVPIFEICSCYPKICLLN